MGARALDDHVTSLITFSRKRNIDFDLGWLVAIFAVSGTANCASQPDTSDSPQGASVAGTATGQATTEANAVSTSSTTGSGNTVGATATATDSTTSTTVGATTASTATPTSVGTSSVGGGSNSGSNLGTGDGSVSAGGTASSQTSSSGGDGAGGTSTATGVCSQSGVLLCDDFEGAVASEPPPLPWTLAMNGVSGTALVDATAPARSGTNSVRVDSAGNYQTFFAIQGAPVFPAPESALYARAYLRLNEPMTEGHNTYFKAGAASAISSDDETRLGVMASMLMINQPDGDRGFLSNQNYWTDGLPGVVIEAQTWTCVEGFFDPPNSTVRFWVDEVEVPDLNVTDWQQDALGSFHFGFEKYAGPDTTIWYDDIVISIEPIGCGPLAP